MSTKGILDYKAKNSKKIRAMSPVIALWRFRGDPVFLAKLIFFLLRAEVRLIGLQNWVAYFFIFYTDH